MQKPIGNLIFTFALIVVLCWATYESVFWPSETKLFPTTMGVIALLLSLIIFGRDLRRVYFSGGAGRVSNEEAGDPFQLEAAIGVLLWLAGFGLAIWLLGFHIAAFLFVFLFVKLRGGYSALASLAFALVAAGGIYLIFVYVFHQPVYLGLILGYISNL